jgi:hypothetical protein
MSDTQEGLEEARRVLGSAAGRGMHCISFQGKDSEGNDCFIEALVDDDPLPAEGEKEPSPSRCVPDQTNPRSDQNAQH